MINVRVECRVTGVSGSTFSRCGYFGSLDDEFENGIQAVLERKNKVNFGVTVALTVAEGVG